MNLWDDLLVINVDKVNIEESKADHSIDLWWRYEMPQSNSKEGLSKKERSPRYK